MLRELVEAAGRLRADGALPPSGTREKKITWRIDVGSGRPIGPYNRGKGDAYTIRAPHRYRSGQPSSTNLKPYLLVDDARYALGLGESGKDSEARLLHGGFVDLLAACSIETGDGDVRRVLDFLAQPLPEPIGQSVAPRDFVAFEVPGVGGRTLERPEILRFWERYLEQEHADGPVAACSICGELRATVRLLPQSVTIMGQDCKITSFNKSAFNSFGREQTANAPLCFGCASAAIDALDYFIETPRYHAVLVRDESRGARNPLRNQLAVFWLRDERPLTYGREAVDLMALQAALFAPQGPREPDEAALGPPPTEGQLERLVTIPWHASEATLRINSNSFFLAVLSANKGRLVVREWIAERLDRVIANLRVYLDAVRLISPDGTTARTFPIQDLLGPLDSTDPNLVRGLLRSAYLGQSPPLSLLAAAITRWRVPDKRVDTRKEREAEERRRHALAAALKLSLTFGTEAAEGMTHLAPGRSVAAYQCGRLLAILEDAQRRAAETPLNSTIVDRFYGAASTTPAAAFGTLINLAHTAHLPKIRKTQRGYGRIAGLLEEVSACIDDAGGFPQILTMPGQAEFALGFYHQRAAFRAERLPTGQTS